MYALNTGRHLEDSFTKSKRDTYLIPCLLYLSKSIAHWQLMQRVKASGGLERPANRSTKRRVASNKVLLKDTLHAPDLCHTVMLIWILKAGYTEQFAGNSCGIEKGEGGRIIGHKQIVHSYCKLVSEISAEPVSTISRFIAGSGHISVDAARVLTVFALVPSPEFV